MNARGQASIEFVLVLLFMLVMLLSIVFPLGQTMQNALTDVRTVGSLSAGLTKIDHTISLFTSISGNNRQVLDLYLPPDTNWLCDPVGNKISVTFMLNNPVYNLDGTVPSMCKDPSDQTANPGLQHMICTKTIDVAPYDLSCQGDKTKNFGLEVSSSGFAQRFAVGTIYSTPPPTFAPIFEVDFNATA